MIRDINGLSSPPAGGNRTERQQQLTEKAQSNATVQKQAVDAPEKVNISSQAQRLKSLEEDMKSLPDVNEERVNQIKAALESGEYQVDDLVLADKIIASEALFGK